MSVRKKRNENLNYERWEPIYKEIINDFKYSEELDRKSAEILSKIRGSDGSEPLNKIKGEIVEVIGPFAEDVGDNYIVSAGSAVSKLESINIKPDLMVSDLDGNTKLQLDLNLDGVPMVMHAHGDNIQTIKNWAPKFKGHVISTCQCKPPEGIYNFGGFTDGDRAVFISDHFKAKKIILNGWDFKKPSSKDVDLKMKKKKLKWAEKLINKIKSTPVVKI